MKKNATKPTKSKAVIVRTYSAGVHYGYLAKRSGQEVTLTNARRIWSRRGANTLHEISLRGVGDGSKISDPVGEILLLHAIEIIPCTKVAIAKLEASKWG